MLILDDKLFCSMIILGVNIYFHILGCKIVLTNFSRVFEKHGMISTYFRNRWSQSQRLMFFSSALIIIPTKVILRKNVLLLGKK